jgi:two-component system, sensor histidine kinase and response regulator
MIELIKTINKNNDYFLSNWGSKFLFVDNASVIKKIKPDIKLCIIKTDFGKSDLKCIEKLKSKYKDIEFWISSNNVSRENILIVNKIGIKCIVSSPFDKKLVEDFFNTTNNIYNAKVYDKYYDLSCIANSKIMIVDDNKMNVELLKEILSPLNVEISTFLKPKNAYSEMLNKKFDLFLLDVMMPEMSGFELAQKVRSSSLNSNSKVVFISALSDAHNKIKGYDIGSSAYIEKPFDINIVKSQIFNILKTQKAQENINSSKETFLATVAHDLKTPINAEINALKLLLNNAFGELDKEQQEIVEDILYSTKFMKDLVENILCKNKIESSKNTLSKQVYSINETVEHCIELTKYLLKPKQQKIEFESNIDNPLLPIDFTEIKRAINNLIINASEYSLKGGKISIKVFCKNNFIGLSVQDFGKGIDKKEQKEIFAKYISFAKKYKKVGSGLGLYITKKIIEAHDGKINLESKIGYGTKITIFLPRYVKE